jgi:hypothetical protein
MALGNSSSPNMAPIQAPNDVQSNATDPNVNIQYNTHMQPRMSGYQPNYINVPQGNRFEGIVFQVNHNFSLLRQYAKHERRSHGYEQW